MSRVVDVSEYGRISRHVSRFRRSQEYRPMRSEYRRVGFIAPRSRRLPFLPGYPVPVIQLRGRPDRRCFLASRS